MPITLIFGGSGKVAQHLTRILTSAKPPHTVYSIIRNPDYVSDIQALGAEPVVESIEDSSLDDMVATLQKYKPDNIVWSAGAGGKGDPSRTQAIDRDGAIRSMDAAAKAGVKRYVMVSAIDVRDREGKPIPDWYTESDVKRSDGTYKAIGKYMRAKFEADKELREGNNRRNLAYTIVRPGSLSMGPSTGKVTAGKIRLDGEISREDVAKVIAEVLETEGTVGLAFDVLGGDTPIREAVKKIADEKIDTFEGYY
jgi:nucleoside-diphosphate-sugar epimerase